ncbi:RepB family plasmid replication initiator protein [Lutibacter sp. B2]|nr:RepB family plasmid replication initiator protein [Lutibacter sp. B2]
MKERSFTVEELRDVLGIQKKQYPQYANFKQKVLKVAFEEINEKTDLNFKFEEIKKGRKVDKIKFFIKSQKKVLMEDTVLDEVAVTIENDEEEIVYTGELKKIIKEKLTEDELKAILKAANYDMDKIKEKYEIAKVSSYTNLVAFLISAITNNYQLPKKNKTSTNQFNNFQTNDTEYTNEELEKLIRWK